MLRLISSIILLLVVGIILNIVVVYNNNKRLNLQNICKIYIEEGKPEAIIINGRKYTKNILDSLFIDQEDQEQDLSNCIQIIK